VERATRWDMSGSGQRRSPVPQMSREEMIKASPNQGYRPGQYRLHDRRPAPHADGPEGDQLFQNVGSGHAPLLAPLESERAKTARPPSLPAIIQPAPAASNFDQTLNTALQMVNTFLKDPEKWGPEYLQEQYSPDHLAQTKEFGPNAEATGNISASMAIYSPPRPARSPTTPPPKTKSFDPGPGTTVARSHDPKPGPSRIQPSENPGGPATEIGRGLTEKPGNPAAIQHMTEADKLDYQHSAHVFQNSLDPKENKRPPRG